MAKKRINRKPKPGVYEGIPYEVYDSWPYVNHSSLRHAMRSAAHYLWAMENGVTLESKSLRFGSLVHALAADDLTGIYIFHGPEWEDMRARYKRPTATREWEHRVGKIRKKLGPDTQVYTAQEHEAAVNVWESVKAHPIAADFFRDARREVSIVWDDQATGVRCKARLDAVNSYGITDLKTTGDASDFERSIRAFRYYRQLAFYQAGWAQVAGGELLEARIVAVESSACYGVRAAPLSDRLLAAGREEYEVALTRIARAIDSDRWEGYQSPDQWDSDMKTEVTVWIDGEEHTW